MLDGKFSVIILAAGNGSRMLSDIPKVMHKIGGKSMLQHLIDTVVKIGVRCIYVVYNSNCNFIKKAINFDVYKTPICWILQKELLGTGHAIQQTLFAINNDKEEVLILYGDVPLISYKTLQNLYLNKLQCDISLLTAILANPMGYGRVIRNTEGSIINIIEDNDIIYDKDKRIKEVNTGIFIAVVKDLRCWLKKLIVHIEKNEFYLTDIINIAYHMGYIISAIQPINTFEIMGVNDKADLVRLDKIYQKNQAQYLLSMGVIISDLSRFDIRGTLICGKDVFIDINVIIEGHVVLGDKVNIGASCILRDSIVEDNVIIYPFSIIENAMINNQSEVGPFARLRPGTELKEKSRVGNFVELKNTRLGDSSKVSHLSYLGDTEIGSQVNIGAGTIFCNYDGLKKNRTRVGDNVFIGSGSQLVAPLTIGKNAVIGAGTTVTQDVLENETVISRIRQFSILNTKHLKK